MTIGKWLLGLFWLALLASCEDSAQPFIDAVKQRELGVASIAIASHESRLPVGGAQRLTLVSTDFDGTQTTFSGQANWTSSATRLATVADGLVDAVTEGDVTITATVGDATVSTTLEIYSSALADFALTPDPFEVAECALGTVTLLGTFADGSTFLLLPPFSTTAPSGLIVSDAADGLNVHTQAAGSYSLPIAVSGVERTLSVVASDSLSSIALNSTSVSLSVGGSHQFAATARFSDGSTSDISALGVWSLVEETPSTALTLSSSTPGQVVADASGSGTVRFSCGGIEVDASVLVDSSSVLQRLEIGQGAGEIDLASGAIQELELTAHYADGSAINVTEQAEWTVTLGDTAAVSVSNTAGSKGIVTAGSSIESETSAVVRAEFGGLNTIVQIFVERN